MALGKQQQIQSRLFVSMDSIPRSRGHIFYDNLQKILRKANFDTFAETLCAPFYADCIGRPSIPPGRYFRMHMVGYFEGLDSERGIVWRCADSLSLREFLQLEPEEAVPNQSSLSRTRSRLSVEIHDKIFQWVIGVIARAGLVHGKRIGVDSSTMEANAALRNIVRRDSGEQYRDMLERMCKESGIKTPTNADIVRFDKGRKDKKLSNEDWQSSSDADARIARMKDKTTHFAYKPEHAVDLDTGAILAAPVHLADKVDSKTIEATLEVVEKTLEKLDKKQDAANEVEIVADKGYFAKKIIKNLAAAKWTTRIAEPELKHWYTWNDDYEARNAVYANRARLKSGVGKAAMRKRSEIVERSFQHVLDRGGQRRSHLRGQSNVQKSYLLAVAGFNLGLLMRSMLGFGTPKGLANGLLVAFLRFCDDTLWILCFAHTSTDENTTSDVQILAIVTLRGWA